MQKNPKIVVIGGGTGSFTVLSGLKEYTSNLTAVVNMSDDGGSSGRLRDEHGLLPPGDINQCIAALSENPYLRDMLKIRYKDIDGLSTRERGQIAGHSWGNLSLLLLNQNGMDFEEAVDTFSKGLSVKGKVAPVTTTLAELRAELDDGQIIKGEFVIGHFPFGNERPVISLEPEASLTESAHHAISEADVIVIAPGNLYGSIAPALIVKGMREALAATKAKKMYVSNLVTKPGQTEDFKVHDYANEIERFIGAPVLDYVLFNTDEPTPSLRSKYVRKGETVLEFDLDVLQRAHYRAIGLPLIAKDPVPHEEGDQLSNERTLIRHDTDVLAKEVIKLLGKK